MYMISLKEYFEKKEIKNSEVLFDVLDSKFNSDDKLRLKAWTIIGELENKFTPEILHDQENTFIVLDEFACEDGTIKLQYSILYKLVNRWDVGFIRLEGLYV